MRLSECAPPAHCRPGYELTATAKPYDWTYTTTYPGHHPHPDEPSDSEKWIDADSDNPAHAIPLAELARPDPILFYAGVSLLEDELHDNGSSHLLVRRVSVLSMCPLPVRRRSRARKARHAHLYIYPCAIHVARERMGGTVQSGETCYVTQVARGHVSLAILHQLLRRNDSDLTPIAHGCQFHCKGPYRNATRSEPKHRRRHPMEGIEDTVTSVAVGVWRMIGNVYQ